MSESAETNIPARGGAIFWQRIAPVGIVLLLAVGTFYLCFGFKILDPTNIAWIAHGDSAQHYLGWLFFRHGPWTWPIGLNPHYGAGLGSSILMSDSNPLMAFLFKPFSQWLPNTFQYTGIWILICVILQGCFGWLLVTLVSRNWWICSFGTLLFLFTPSFIFRMALGHAALGSHFLLLAALYLVLAPAVKRRTLAWGAVLTIAALVHPYILAMVASLWLADLLSRYTKGQRTARGTAYQSMALVAWIGFVCWQVGFFVAPQGLHAHGFGFFRMNALSLFSPDGWSYVLPNIQAGQPAHWDDFWLGFSGAFEGFNFLGLGGILLLVLAAPMLFSRRIATYARVKRHWVLLLLFVGLTIFALSNYVVIGPYVLVYPLPAWVIKLAGMFHASGRFFWPVFYGLLTALLFMLARGYRHRVAIGLLALVVVVQLIDTSSGYLRYRKQYAVSAASTWNGGLSGPFWSAAAQRYTSVRLIPATRFNPYWRLLGYYAGTHRMTTDAVYLARVDQRKLKSLARAKLQRLHTANYDQETLYVLPRNMLSLAIYYGALRHAAVGHAHGLAIVAPGWQRCSSCPHVPNQITMAGLDSIVAPNRWTAVSRGSKAVLLLGPGWSHPEHKGIWTSGHDATIRIPMKVSEDITQIAFKARVLVNETHPVQRVRFVINGIAAGAYRLHNADVHTIRVPVTPPMRKKALAKGWLEVQIHTPDAASPRALGISGDTRTLAFWLGGLRLEG